MSGALEVLICLENSPVTKETLEVSQKNSYKLFLDLFSVDFPSDFIRRRGVI